MMFSVPVRIGRLVQNAYEEAQVCWRTKIGVKQSKQEQVLLAIGKSSRYAMYLSCYTHLDIPKPRLDCNDLLL